MLGDSCLYRPGEPIVSAILPKSPGEAVGHAFFTKFTDRRVNHCFGHVISELLFRNPITDIADCCAHAASGHAAAAPPSAASNSRRLMVTVIRPSRARCVKTTIPRHERAVLTAWPPARARRASASTDRRPSHAPACFQQLSALPPQADLITACRMSASSGLMHRSKPSAWCNALFDHLVGEREDIVGDFQSERPRGPQVDYQLEFGRLMDRQLRGLGPLQNLRGI